MFLTASEVTGGMFEHRIGFFKCLLLQCDLHGCLLLLNDVSGHLLLLLLCGVDCCYVVLTVVVVMLLCGVDCGGDDVTVVVWC